MGKRQAGRNRVTERETHSHRQREMKRKRQRQRDKTERDTLRHTHGTLERGTQTEARTDTETDTL